LTKSSKLVAQGLAARPACDQVAASDDERLNDKDEVFRDTGIKVAKDGDPKKLGDDKFGVGGPIEKTGNDFCNGRK
jgi:hypothetical protein